MIGAPSDATAAEVSHLTNPARERRDFLAAIFEPPPPIDLNLWAKDNLILGTESPFPGPYDGSRFPFFHEILDVLGPEHEARVVTVLGSAQIGKTFIAQIFIAASLDLDPGQILYVHPTENNAIRYARTKWRPMIQSTPRLTRILETKQSKEGGNSTLFQMRRDGRGSIQLSGANSAASLSMITVKRQVQDDLSKWENNPAGDPEAQADSRSKAFVDAKILKLGTGLLMGSCRISRSFEAGSQHRYHVPCPHCGHVHPLEPENFIEHIDADHPELAHFRCPECDGEIHERHRREMVERGKWIAHNEAAIDLSYGIWAAYAPLESWERIARSYLASLGDPTSEQVWWNDTAGRAYELPGEAPDWQELKRRAEAGGRQLGQIPYGALMLIVGLDCQDDYVDGVVVGFGRNLSRQVIARVRIEGHISTPETRAELNRLVEFEWPTVYGSRRKADLCGIDANAWTDDVFDWAKNFPKSRVIMVRGVKGDAAPALALVRRERRADGRIVKYQGRFFNVGVNSIKGALYKFLRVEKYDHRGFIDFPAGFEDDYYEQLTAEKRTAIVDRAGFTVYAWIKPRGQRNEQLDCMVYAQAMATKLGWRIMTDENWDRLAENRELPAEVRSSEHAANEFWNRDSMPSVASPDLLPAPPPVKVPTILAARPIVRSNFGMRRW
jgi:phage terminase large subunit GpA-like protein